MVEEHMAHGNAYFRWVDPEGSSHWLPNQMTEIPAPIRGFIKQNVVKRVKQSLWGHGLGRHTDPEILHLLREDLLALSALLGKKKFFLDDKKVHLVDITVYALLTNILNVPVEHKFKELVKTFDNLVAFTDRVEKIVESK
jgi:glutathione S-transferase